MRYNNRCGRIRAGQPVVKASSNFMGAALERLIWFQRKLTTANGKKGGSLEAWIVEKRAPSKWEDCSRPICFVRGVCVGCATVRSSEELTRNFDFPSSLSLSLCFVRRMIDSMFRKIFVRQNLDLFFFISWKGKRKRRRRRGEERKSETKSRNFYNFNLIGNDWRFCVK